MPKVVQRRAECGDKNPCQFYPQVCVDGVCMECGYKLPGMRYRKRCPFLNQMCVDGVCVVANNALRTDDDPAHIPFGKMA